MRRARRVGGGAPARHLTTTPVRLAQGAGALSLPADTAPLFVPVVTDLHRDGAMSAAVADGTGVVHIEQAHLRVSALQHQ